MPTDCMYVYESLPGCILGGLIIVTLSVRVYTTVCMDLSLSESKLEFFFLGKRKTRAIWRIFLKRSEKQVF